MSNVFQYHRNDTFFSAFTCSCCQCCRCRRSWLLSMILFAAPCMTLNYVMSCFPQAYPREMKLKASLEVTEHPRQKILILRQLKQLTHRDYSGSLEIALLTTIGVFNRPTFLAYAVGPILFWLYRGPPLKKISCIMLHLRCIYLLSVAVPASILLVCVDTIYYEGGKLN